MARALHSARMISDELIVVDGGSRDNTVAIAEEFTSHIFFRAWDDDFAAQKNFALSQAREEWVFSLDADEEVSAELAAEIKHFLSSDLSTQYSGMYLPRKNIIFGKWLRYGACWPDFQLRLFRRDSVFTRRVHETVDTKGTCSYLNNPIIHHHYPRVRDFIARTRKYTDMEAREMSAKGEIVYFWQIIFYPLAKFFQVYFFKMGFRDGWKGLVYATLLAYYSGTKRYKVFKMLSQRVK